MQRAATILDRLPIFALVAALLFWLEAAFASPATMTQAAAILLFGTAIALAPLAQAAGLADVPGAAIGAIVIAAVFVVAAAVELTVMRLLRKQRARTRWLVRLGALLAFAAILFLTPPAGPMKLF
jgi:hypothetical protein